MTDSNDLADGVWPYRSETPTYRQIPQDAVDRADVYELLRRISRREDAIGDAGRVTAASTAAITITGQVAARVLPTDERAVLKGARLLVSRHAATRR